jgi:hypothetical protein
VVHKPIKYLDDEDEDDDDETPKMPEMNYDKIIASLAEDQDVTAGDSSVPRFEQVCKTYCCLFADLSWLGGAVRRARK